MKSWTTRPSHRSLPGGGGRNDSTHDRDASCSPQADGVARATRPLHGSQHTMPQLPERIWPRTDPDQCSNAGEAVRDLAADDLAAVLPARPRILTGLAELGVIRGDIVAVLGDNRPEWLIAELAAQTLGASVVGIYPTSIGDELTHILESSALESSWQKTRNRSTSFSRSRLLKSPPAWPSASSTSCSTIRTDSNSTPTAFSSTSQRSKPGSAGACHELGLARFPDRPQGDVDDIAVICTTSGTTSKPKLAYLVHANLLSMAANLDSRSIPIDTRTSATSRYCLLPGSVNRCSPWHAGCSHGDGDFVPRRLFDSTSRYPRDRARHHVRPSSHLGVDALRGSGSHR